MRVYPTISRIFIVVALAIPIVSGLADCVGITGVTQSLKQSPPKTNKSISGRQINPGIRKARRPSAGTTSSADNQKTPPPKRPDNTRIIVTPNPAQVGEPVLFYLEPNPPSGSALVILFDYGDGSAPEKKQPTMDVLRHRFLAAGTYKVSVTCEVRGVMVNIQIQPVIVNVVPVKLVATPLSMEVGIPVLLKATSISKDKALRYRFSFGDNTATPWQVSNEAPPHSYKVTGKYQPRVEVGFGDSPNAVDGTDSNPVTIVAPPAKSLALRVDPVHIDEGKPVTLSAKFPAKGRQIQYRFRFGDNQTTEWQDEGELKHSYAVGTYRPAAEVGVVLDGEVYSLASTVGHTIEVVALQRPSVPPAAKERALPLPAESPVPTPPTTITSDSLVILILISVGLAIVAGVLVAGHKLRKSLSKPSRARRPVPAKPTFVAHLRAGTASVVHSPKKPLIGFELYVNANLAEGVYELIKSEPNLVRSERSRP